MPRRLKNLPRTKLSTLLRAAKRLAKQYRALTGRPLGITGEVAEFEASRLLGLKLSDARRAGYDATRSEGGRTIRYQIKGRVLFKDSKRGQRVGSIKLSHSWDKVLLVLLDEDLGATEIYELRRRPIRAALAAPGSKARNLRGALSISWFKNHGQLVWKRKAPRAAA
jgi:hypothetical protein